MSEHYRYRAYFCLFLFWFSLYNKLIPLIRCTIYLRKLVSFWLTEIIGMQFFPGDRLVCRQRHNIFLKLKVPENSFSDPYIALSFFWFSRKL